MPSAPAPLATQAAPAPSFSRPALATLSLQPDPALCCAHLPPHGQRRERSRGSLPVFFGSGRVKGGAMHTCPLVLSP